MITDEQMKDLRRSFGNLESKVKEIYSFRKPRPLIGDNGILMRTLGEKFIGPSNYEKTYFDDRRKENAQTEFAEFIEALEVYDSSHLEEDRVELYLEAGDILFQKEAIDLWHKNDPCYSEVNNKFTTALSYVEQELSRRSMSIEDAKRAAVIKYSTRSWLSSQGLKAKDKELEKKICLEELKSHEAKWSAVIVPKDTGQGED